MTFTKEEFEIEQRLDFLHEESNHLGYSELEIHGTTEEAAVDYLYQARCLTEVLTARHETTISLDTALNLLLHIKAEAHRESFRHEIYENFQAADKGREQIFDLVRDCMAVQLKGITA